MTGIFGGCAILKGVESGHVIHKICCMLGIKEDFS